MPSSRQVELASCGPSLPRSRTVRVRAEDGTRLHTEVFAQDEIRELAEALPEFGADTVVWHADPGWAGATGNPVDLAAAEVSLLEETPDVYVCGPPPMVDAAYAALTAAGVPEEQIHVERFSAVE